MITSKQNLVLSIHPQKHVVAPTGEDNKCLASLHCRVEYLLLDFAIYDDTQRTLNELKEIVMESNRVERQLLPSSTLAI